MNETVSKNQKSGLAKLLATENISVRHENIPTAYFNVRTRTLGLPNWDNASADVYDLLVGHEVGHALFTPNIDLPKIYETIDADNIPAVKSFVNVIEDVRIEKKIKRKFAGLRKNFYKGYSELVERDFFGVKDRSLSDYAFIDRINLFFKGNGAFDVPFTDEEKSIVNEIASSETFEEVVDLAKKIYNHYSDDVDKESISDDGIGEESEDGEYGDDSTSASGSGEEESPESDTTESSEVDETDDSSGDENVDESSDDDAQSSGKGQPNKPSESETQKSFDDSAVEHLTDEHASEPFYASIPSINSEPFIIERKLISKWLDGYRGHLQTETLLDSYNNFKTDSKRTVNYLTKEFELKKNAQQHARASVSKTGVLNVDKLHTYKFSDDLFKRVTIVPDGKNHGLILFVDWSSSIIGSTLPIAKQVLNLAWFCKKVNIPFEVYAFTDNVKLDSERDYVSACDYKDGDVTVSNVHLLNFLSSRIKTNAFNQACLDYYTVAWSVDNGSYWSLPENLILSSTPLNDTVLLAHDIIPKFKSSNGLEVVNAVFLTDGESNGLDYIVDRSQPSGLTGFRTGGYYGSTETSYITDNTTKISYEVSQRSQVTNVLLRSLHDRLGINVIGFFVTGSGYGYKNAIVNNCLGGRWGYDHNELKKLAKQFNRDGSLVVGDHDGYNEFYLIKGGKALDTESDLEVAEDASKRVLTTAFKKHSKSKTVNKVILSRFIKLIA